jgi:hypothetical protein
VVKVDQDKCPFQNTFESIGTSDWEFYVKGESMNPNFSCKTKNPNYLNHEIESVNQVGNAATNELEKQTNDTNEVLRKWGNSYKDFTKVITDEKKLSSEINMYGRPVFREGFTTTDTLNSMVNDSIELKNRNRGRILFWSFIAITLVIMAFRVLQLYSK